MISNGNLLLTPVRIVGNVRRLHKLDRNYRVLPEERRQKVLDLVKGRGFVALAELATELQASESTLRRDLDYWDQQGVLRRTHGGAAVASDGAAAGTLPALEDRAMAAAAEKRQIARTMAECI